MATVTQGNAAAGKSATWPCPAAREVGQGIRQAGRWEEVTALAPEPPVDLAGLSDELRALLDAYGVTCDDHVSVDVTQIVQGGAVAGYSVSALVLQGPTAVPCPEPVRDGHGTAVGDAVGVWERVRAVCPSPALRALPGGAV